MGEPQRWLCTVALYGIVPRIWRAIEIDSDISLHDFNLVIQAAFGWEFPAGDYDFYIGDKHFKERNLYDSDDEDRKRPEPIPLYPLLEGLPGQRFRYVRTDEASWEYTIELSAIIGGYGSSARCADGEGAMPTDEFGGNSEYGRFLIGQQDASASLRDWYKEWADEAKDSPVWFNSFDLSAANELLLNLGEFEFI